MAFYDTIFNKGGAPITPASVLNGILNVLKTIAVEIRSDGQQVADISRTPDGKNWKIRLPVQGHTRVTGKTLYMVYQITDATETSQGQTADFDWVRAHA